MCKKDLEAAIQVFTQRRCIHPGKANCRLPLRDTRPRHAVAVRAWLYRRDRHREALKVIDTQIDFSTLRFGTSRIRWPTLHSIGLRLIDRGRVFLQQAGTVILCVSLFVWGLTNLPLYHGQPPELEQSIAARLGHFIEPVIRPLGFNWKIGVGLLTSVVAREVIVGTLGTLYEHDPQTESVSLQVALRHDLTFSGAMALLVFFAFAMQRTSTLAVVRRETNSWKWPIIQFVYMTGLAFLAALIVNRVSMVIHW